MAADQFCLRWNNFQLNIASALDSLKADGDLVDVTLSCEGQNVKAHKVVLSACSPYFRGVFKENPCQHPIVILKDVTYEDVSALLSFMYQGEVYITQDRLASFLHTAELLQVRGLTGATNPFKDAPKQCKTKKPMPTSAGQLRHDTPPLSSPPPVPLPLQPSNKTQNLLPISKSPLMTPKESHSSFSLIQTKPTALNSSTTLHQHPSTVTQPLPFQQHSTPSQYRSPASPSYQQSSSGQQSTFPQHTALSGESSQTQLHHSSDTDQTNTRSLSPQPPAAKRRKAFPRRVSVSGHSTTEDSADSPEAGEKPRSSDDQIGCEVVSLGGASVKQEPEDETIFEVDATMEEESNPITFPSADEDVVRMESPGSDVVRRLDYFGNMETVVSEEPVPAGSDAVKEEPVVEGVPSITPHSMLLRSLSGAKQPAVVGDSSPSRLGDGITPSRPQDDADGSNFKGNGNIEEIFGIPTWPTNKTHSASDLFILSESVSIVNRRFGKQRLNSVDESTSQDCVQNTRNEIPNVNVVLGTEVQPSFSVVDTRSRYYAASSSDSNKNSLYQQRKHSWRSRRPVECPNCQKIITMAYNLKSHLSTCLKRNGLRNKVGVKFDSEYAIMQ